MTTTASAKGEAYGKPLLQGLAAPTEEPKLAGVARQTLYVPPLRTVNLIKLDVLGKRKARRAMQALSRAAEETSVKVYRSVDELPEVLEPGKYIVGEAELEVHEPTSRRVIEKMLQLLRERPGHRFI